MCRDGVPRSYRALVDHEGAGIVGEWGGDSNARVGDWVGVCVGAA